MRTVKLKLLIVCIIVGCLAAGPGTAFAERYFSILTGEDWDEAMMENNIRGMTQPEWDDYMLQFNNPANLEGEHYRDTNFIPPELYVYTCDPCDSGAGSCDAAGKVTGLVMAWGDSQMPDGRYASAWVYDYLEDPDLSNSSVTIQVEPPCGITTISVGLRDINLRIRSWRWNVAATGAVPPLPVGTLQCSPDPVSGLPVRHTITINLAQTGTTAASPQAASYSNYNSPPNPPPPFDITQVQSFVYDEDANYVAGSWVPPPGTTDPNPWNYWFNLTVTPNPPPVEGKFFVKWSQPPVRDTVDPNYIYGWDEWSWYYPGPILADDWECTDERPVTDVHWWGSFWGWDIPVPPPVVPQAFHIGVWTDVPWWAAPEGFSHPGNLIWENYCDNWVWEFIAYDKDPWQVSDINDSCFQFTQLLSQDEWFFQEPDGPWDTDGDPNSAVFWLSISAIYDPCGPVPKYPFGWKTRPHHWNDDAVFIDDAMPWPPTLGAMWMMGRELWGPMESWDLSFELTTKEPAYEDDPIPGDLNADRIVNLNDLAILGGNWLATAPMLDI
jgi:hypothetical protein